MGEVYTRMGDRGNSKQVQGGGLLSLLTGRQIQCLALAYYDNLSKAEIGRRLGITGEAVGQTIKRGLDTLKLAGVSLDRVKINKPTVSFVDPYLLDTRIIK